MDETYHNCIHIMALYSYDMFSHLSLFSTSRHGAKRATCNVEGCSNKVSRGGTCARHGKETRCTIDGCYNQQKKDGRCTKHAIGLQANVPPAPAMLPPPDGVAEQCIPAHVPDGKKAEV